MLSFNFARLAIFLSALVTVMAAPFDISEGNLSNEARSVLARAAPAAPRFVAYQDAWVSGETGPPDPSVITGFNVFAMAFLLASGSADQATEWQELTADQRASVKAEYAAAGISLIVSAFGSTETPTSSGFDPTDTANTIASWVQTYDVDGVDIDYEDFAAFDKGDGSAETWLATFTTALRSQLPSGQYIITHAPVAPWFSTGTWGGGGYLKVHESVGSLIDWYNVQFYNQGVSEYTTCDNLLTASSSTWPSSALFQIIASGVDQSKLVIGKPATTADANNGYIDPTTLGTCLSQAKGQGWTGGAMVWQYPNADSAWIASVRADSWPVSSSGGGGSTSTSPTSTTSSPGSSPTSGSCSGVSAWSSAVAYTGGEDVTYDGYLWTAKWWTEDDTPGGAAGVWTKGAACSANGPASAKPTPAAKPTTGFTAIAAPELPIHTSSSKKASTKG